MASTRERDLAVFKARMAQRVDRLSDMVMAVDVLAEMHEDLTAVECGLLWEAYRKKFLEKFSSLRAMASAVEEVDGADNFQEFILSYNGVITAELKTVCKEALNTLETHLLPYATDPENTVLYNSMIGDNYWVLGMVADEDEDGLGFLEKALAAYEASYELALEKLTPGHQLRLCVVLNLSAFHYDMLNNVERAFFVANEGLTKSGTHEMTEEGSKIFLQIVDNVAKWTHEESGIAAYKDDGSEKEKEVLHVLEGEEEDVEDDDLEAGAAEEDEEGPALGAEEPEDDYVEAVAAGVAQSQYQTRTRQGLLLPSTYDVLFHLSTIRTSLVVAAGAAMRSKLLGKGRFNAL